ncbi:hypothetical protein SISNIDRAFT_488532 [Sistotremastrum niveocremeum HHB9708]|uniref:F-box domain-containing protein n=1 Tax=Sistotremastrum niveocremeum HHB9708 TaxID=1314777 RepID=A0A164R7Y6_9AGAM|nr:hypothetical protein SISNIDRAFT_488532 [Sistotremastrum niveocremeum HHB9708]
MNKPANISRLALLLSTQPTPPSPALPSTMLSAPQQQGVFKIPSEVTELSLIYSHPRDVAAFAQTCKYFYALVYSSVDSHLWRYLFLAQGFDDPRIKDATIDPTIKVDWKANLQHIIHIESLLKAGFFQAPRPQRIDILTTLVNMVVNVGPISPLLPESGTLKWVQRQIDLADLHTRPGPFKVVPEKAGSDSIPPGPEGEELEEVILRHRLHNWLGLSPKEQHESQAVSRRLKARSFIYDLRRYSKKTQWAPLLPENPDRANWIHVDYLQEVLAWNVYEHGDGLVPHRPPLGLEATRPYSAPGNGALRKSDWAGVEGKWRRIVSFMDYRDIYAFNFTPDGQSGTRDPEVFLQEGFEEATRFITLDLQITGFSPTYSNSPSPLKNKECGLHTDLGPRPTIHFSGTSKGGSGNESSVKGVVRVTRHGLIRWAFVSIFEGRMQWTSEGIQIGAVGSAIGVAGSWTGAHHEDGDPAGPFWLFKLGQLEHCLRCGKRV